MDLTVRELRQRMSPQLEKAFFRTNPGRIVFLFAGYGAAVVHFVTTIRVLSGELPVVAFVITLVIAANIETFLFFFMHEVLHGGVFRSKALINVSAFLGGVPFLCSPYVWRIWHNHHHRHTATREDTDRQPHPDFDDLNSRITRVHEFGKRLRYDRIASFIIPFFVISGHHLLMLALGVARRGPLRLNVARACVEALVVYAIFITPFIFLDLRTSLLGLYAPLLVAHLICNSYILTNHFSNPLTHTNCPLVNTTSVFLLPGLAVTHMGFGRHVEHHIYPHVTHDKLVRVTRFLREMYPSQFQERQLLAVLHSVFAKKHPHDPICGPSVEADSSLEPTATDRSSAEEPSER